LERLWVTNCIYWDTGATGAGVGNHGTSSQGRTIPVRHTVRWRGGGRGITGSHAGGLQGSILAIAVRILPDYVVTMRTLVGGVS